MSDDLMHDLLISFGLPDPDYPNEAQWREDDEADSYDEDTA